MGLWIKPSLASATFKNVTYRLISLHLGWQKIPNGNWVFCGILLPCLIFSFTFSSSPCLPKRSYPLPDIFFIYVFISTDLQSLKPQSTVYWRSSISRERGVSTFVYQIVPNYTFFWILSPRALTLGSDTFLSLFALFPYHFFHRTCLHFLSQFPENADCCVSPASPLANHLTHSTW